MRVEGEGERVRRSGRYLLGRCESARARQRWREKSSPLQDVEEVREGPASDAEDGLNGHIALDGLGFVLGEAVLLLQGAGELGELSLDLIDGTLGANEAKEGSSGSSVLVVCVCSGSASRAESRGKLEETNQGLRKRTRRRERPRG
jgi:hypothetical protein